MNDRLPHEKGFHVSWDQLHRDARALAWRLDGHGPDDGAWRAVVAITRGGMAPAMIVARELDIRMVDTISVKSYTAKWHNVLRQPRVALLVHDGRKQLVIYGRAEAIAQDPDRIGLTERVFRRLAGNPDFAVTDEFVAGMDQQKRTVLRITPDKASMTE